MGLARRRLPAYAAMTGGCAVRTFSEAVMAKGQMKGNKEAKKPKKEKPKTIAAAPQTVKIGTGDKKK